MVNPQVENGFIKIATGNSENDVLMALIKASLSGTEYQLILTILRKTWGFHKKKDWISLTQFEKITGKSRTIIWKSIKKLYNKRIIVKKKNKGKRSIYQFNKNFNEWKTLSNKRTIVEKLPRLGNKRTTKLGNKSYIVNRQPKETNTKETIQKKENFNEQQEERYEDQETPQCIPKPYLKPELKKIVRERGKPGCKFCEKGDCIHLIPDIRDFPEGIF